jgi:hypothetical protein
MMAPRVGDSLAHKTSASVSTYVCPFEGGFRRLRDFTVWPSQA